MVGTHQCRNVLGQVWVWSMACSLLLLVLLTIITCPSTQATTYSSTYSSSAGAGGNGNGVDVSSIIQYHQSIIRDESLKGTDVERQEEDGQQQAKRSLFAVLVAGSNGFYNYRHQVR